MLRLIAQLCLLARADVTDLGLPEHHDDDSSLTIIVKRGKVSVSGNFCLEIWSSGGCR